MLIPQHSTKSEELYYTLKGKLAKKYKPEYYVVINTQTGKYCVGKTSVEAIKKARKKYPQDHLFLAQIGRIAGLMK